MEDVIVIDHKPTQTTSNQYCAKTDLGCTGNNITNDVRILVQSHGEEIAQGERLRVHIKLLFRGHHEFVPVTAKREHAPHRCHTSQ